MGNADGEWDLGHLKKFCLFDCRVVKGPTRCLKQSEDLTTLNIRKKLLIQLTEQQFFVLLDFSFASTTYYIIV